MKQILITGASGNVGKEVIRGLTALESKNLRVIAAVRREGGELPHEVSARMLDFENPDTFASACTGIDVLFLLRPPHLTSVSRVFAPLLKAFETGGGKHVVFLSVQGAESNSRIPHYKIEQLIRESSLSFTFLRPAYFMQNLTTTLARDLREKQEIFLPAGKALFNWIDVADIGDAAAKVLAEAEVHQDQAYVLSGPENLSFSEVAAILTEKTGLSYRFRSPTLLAFFLRKKQQGMPIPMILVMIMLHFLPRFQAPPVISKDFERLMGRRPGNFSEFIDRNRTFFKTSDRLKRKYQGNQQRSQ